MHCSQYCDRMMDVVFYMVHLGFHLAFIENVRFDTSQLFLPRHIASMQRAVYAQCDRTNEIDSVLFVFERLFFVLISKASIKGY